MKPEREKILIDIIDELCFTLDKYSDKEFEVCSTAMEHVLEFRSRFKPKQCPHRFYKDVITKIETCLDCGITKTEK